MKTSKFDHRQTSNGEHDSRNDSSEFQTWLTPPSNIVSSPRMRSFSDNDASALVPPVLLPSPSAYAVEASSAISLIPRKRSHSYESGMEAHGGELKLFQAHSKSGSQAINPRPGKLSLSPIRSSNSKSSFTHDKIINHDIFDINSTKPNMKRYRSQSISSDGNDSDYPSMYTSDENDAGSNSISLSSAVPQHSPKKDKLFPFKCFGICFCFDNTWFFTRASTFVVRHAPCFLCCTQSLEVSATDRDVLFRLNVLCGCFALVQVVVGTFVGLVLNISSWIQKSDSADSIENVRWSIQQTFWNPNISLFLSAIIGLVLLVATIIARKAIKDVNLNGALRFYFILLWVLPIEFFSNLTLIDIHGVTRVWVERFWFTDSFQWFRTTFNSQDDFQTIAFFFYIANGVWGFLLIILVFLTMRALVSIITSPIIQSTREANIAGWFSLPMLFCFVVGAILLPQVDAELELLRICYVTTGVFFVVVMILGIFISKFPVLNAADKKNKHVAVILFIVVSFLTIAAVGVVLIFSVIYTLNLIEVQSSAVSCLICSCDEGNESEDCKFTNDDVNKIIQNLMKQSACLAVLLLMYAFEALRFGFVLHRHISHYQIDYV